MCDVMSHQKRPTMSAKLLFIILLYYFVPTSKSYFSSTKNIDQQCFCKLEGSIDDCSCNIDTVDYFNNMRIYPRLQSLLIKDYFRFYKVNLKQPCPFWSDDSKCAIRYCHVQQCQDDDIPVGLKGETRNHQIYEEKKYDKYLSTNQMINCEQTAKDHNKELGYLNTTISSENYKEFERWQKHDDKQDNFCIAETSPGEYVDLLLNPEKYTGYKGPSAHRIWRSIYLENCFRPGKSTHNFIQASQMSGMCLEKRAFYRVVSGLHASINIHLCAKYLLPNQNNLGIVSTGAEWGPNLPEFQRMFSPDTTGGEGPNWLKNVYFIYLLELRALDKAAPYLKREEYYTGNDDGDEETRQAVDDILEVVRSFPNHFNESCMFNGGSEAIMLKEEFRQHFLNVSRIMDCVGCDKCKLWGKLQVQGLGTALKILFSGKFDEWSPTVNKNIDKKNFYLERSEIVALFNGLGRLSESIFELERFRQMMR